MPSPSGAVGRQSKEVPQTSSPDIPRSQSGEFYFATCGEFYSVIDSARRIDKDPRLSPQKERTRHWRTRSDPLEQIWPRVEDLLKIDGILAVTIFETLQDELGEDVVPDGVRRTLERRISRWRALNGGEKEIIFPQHHPAGRQGLSDFTVCDALQVTIGGEDLDHRLFLFRFACSDWE